MPFKKAFVIYRNLGNLTVMKDILRTYTWLSIIYLVFCDPSGLQAQCAGDWSLAQWSPRDGSDPYSANTPFQLATDDRGNAYMAGYASDSLFLQSSDGNYFFHSPGNEWLGQLVLSKYSRNGDLQWVRGARTDGAFFSPDVAVWNDMVAICGTYFQPPGLPAGHIGAFVTLFDTSGVELWNIKFPGGGVMEAYGICFSPSGDLVVTGSFSGEFDIPGGWKLSTGGKPSDVFIYNSEIFALKLTREGKVKWAVQSGREGEATLFFHRGQPLAIDDTGNVVLGGYFQGVLRWGDLSLRSGRDSGRAPFVAKLDGDTGEVIWLSGAKTVGDDYSNGAFYGLVCDRGRNIYGVGYVQSEFEWDGWPLLPKGNFESLLVCFDESGGVKWVETFGSEDPEDREWAASAMISSYNTLFVGANIFPGTIAGGQLLPSFGKGDIAALEFDLSGAILRGWAYGGPDTDFSYGAALDADGSLLLCGNSLSSSMSFGDVDLEWEETDGRTNSFLYKQCLGLPAVALPGEEGNVKLYPNPGKGVFWLDGNFGKGALEVLVVDMLGRELNRQTIRLNGQKSVYGINAGHLPPGFYCLLLFREGQFLFSMPVSIIQ